MSIQQENFKNIADAIRAKTGETEPIAPSTFAAAIGNVYESGFEAGQNSMYDRFWDSYQEYGNRANYEYAFSNRGWNNTTLKPKYNIAPTYATSMFLNSTYAGDLRDLSISFDFSNCGSFSNCFAYSYELTGVGIVDTRSASNLTAMFLYCRKIETIEKWILKNDGSQTYSSNPFSQCYKLKNIVVEGAIGQNLSFQHSTELTKDSITSIINALYSSASGKTLTLSKAAVDAIDWTGTVVGGVTCNTFEAVANTRSNWQISLL